MNAAVDGTDVEPWTSNLEPGTRNRRTWNRRTWNPEPSKLEPGTHLEPGTQPGTRNLAPGTAVRLPLEYSNVRQVAIALVVVESVADDEMVVDGESDILH